MKKLKIQSQYGNGWFDQHRAINYPNYLEIIKCSPFEYQGSSGLLGQVKKGKPFEGKSIFVSARYIGEKFCNLTFFNSTDAKRIHSEKPVAFGYGIFK